LALRGGGRVNKSSACIRSMATRQRNRSNPDVLPVI
jgi:hypothetical protein